MTAQRHTHPNSEPIPLLRIREACTLRGRSRSAHYADVTEGLMTKPVNIGGRCSAWPANEIAAVNAARIAGKNNDEIRALVKKLEADRKLLA